VKEPANERVTAQHSTAQHSTAQHSTAQHSTAQHSTAQHSTAQHKTRANMKSGQVLRSVLWKCVKQIRLKIETKLTNTGGGETHFFQQTLQNNVMHSRHANYRTKHFFPAV
jgi:hypothetical protein